MKVRFYNAKNGDAIHLVTGAEKNILVDMGFPETYSKYIKKHIKLICDNDHKVDLLVVSHIDQDHIGGVINFLLDIKKKEFDRKIVNEIWHNSYRHLNISDIKKIGIEDYQVLRILKECFETEYKKEFTSVGDKEISAQQGSTLAGLIYKLGITWNKTFEGGPIFGIRKASIGGTDITILTPNQNIFEKLKRFWRNELLKQKFDFQFGEDELFDDAYEFYLLNEAVFEVGVTTNISGDKEDKFQNLLESGTYKKVAGDRSITNASSISLIIEENGKRVLLTADATDADLFSALKSLSDKGVSMDFDIIKFSHHGALKSNMKWLSLVSAKYWVISTDCSKHKHPDIGSIVSVILNNKGSHKNICFNNHIETIEEIQNPTLMERYNYSVILPDQDWGIEIEL